ncbi:hypothetical protein OIU79_001124 [Salix purpurea]|uniref:Uncharacterized protein n=1 Tax=Salix purpurea TaxID=77065 RepID=A0A9Q0ZNM0_SALPP|nr:hypothetical protein OIU79_001124 [Salix purpurea]
MAGDRVFLSSPFYDWNEHVLHSCQLASGMGEWWRIGTTRHTNMGKLMGEIVHLHTARAHRLIGDEEGIWIREKLEEVMRSGEEDDGGFWRWPGDCLGDCDFENVLIDGAEVGARVCWS